jgi:hypothetical protein
VATHVIVELPPGDTAAGFGIRLVITGGWLLPPQALLATSVAAITSAARMN